MATQKKVAIIGSGNWGSAIARIVGVTTQENTDVFSTDVRMWVYEEEVEGGKLSEIINTRHENVKYLPGKKLPENVRAVTDLLKTCDDADILIFVVPHQFVHRICDQLKGTLKKGAIAISLIKVSLDCLYKKNAFNSSIFANIKYRRPFYLKIVSNRPLLKLGLRKIPFSETFFRKNTIF